MKWASSHCLCPVKWMVSEVPSTYRRRHRTGEITDRSREIRISNYTLPQNAFFLLDLAKRKKKKRAHYCHSQLWHSAEWNICVEMYLRNMSDVAVNVWWRTDLCIWPKFWNCTEIPICQEFDERIPAFYWRVNLKTLTKKINVLYGKTNPSVRLLVKLILALDSTVILGFRFRWDLWPRYLCSPW